MLRVIWMIVEGLLASIGVLFIGLGTFAFRKSMKDPEMMAALNNYGRKLFDEKTD